MDFKAFTAFEIERGLKITANQDEPARYLSPNEISWLIYQSRPDAKEIAEELQKRVTQEGF